MEGVWKDYLFDGYGLEKGELWGTIYRRSVLSPILSPRSMMLIR